MSDDSTATVIPTIKGIFVRSHIDNLEKAKGKKAVKELEKRVGRSVRFSNLEDVPVEEEIKIIENAFDLMTSGHVTPETRAYQSGRLHFKNFTTTPWGKMIFKIFSNNLRYHMMHASNIAERVFRGMQFSAEETGPNALSVQIDNLPYAPDHFRGIFQAWLEHMGYEGNVSVHEVGANSYRYDFTWKER